MCFNFNSSMDMNLIYALRKVWVEITNPLSNLNGATFEVWEWISNFILHIVMDVVAYTYWDKN